MKRVSYLERDTNLGLVYKEAMVTDGAEFIKLIDTLKKDSFNYKLICVDEVADVNKYEVLRSEIESFLEELKEDKDSFPHLNIYRYALAYSYISSYIKTLEKMLEDLK